MDPRDFHSTRSGKVIRTRTGYAAFLPAPLPPELAYSAELALLLSRADAALGELSGLGRNLPNPHLLIEPYARREAVLSSRIEGTQTGLSDLLLDEMGTQTSPSAPPDDVREVRNYVTALEYGMDRLKTLPLSLRLVREMHSRLMKGVRGERAEPGEFRRSQNWIGPAGSTPMTAPYVPPPPDAVGDALSAWESFMHERSRIPDLVQCALIHAQFEAIHPFLDGNGRIGRLLISLFLIERNRLSQPLLYISSYIEKNRQEYYNRLQGVHTHGDWEGWIGYFLAGVAETALEGVRQAGQLTDLRERFRARLLNTPKALALLDALFVNPFMTVARAMDLLKVSNPTARQIIVRLQKEKIVEEITGRAWGRIYLAKPILAAIEGTPTEEKPRRKRGSGTGRTGRS